MPPRWLPLALLLLSSGAWAPPPTCSRYEGLGSQDEYGLSQDGDVLLGGLFPLYNQPVLQDVTYTRPPEVINCISFQARPLRWAMAMVFAVEQINRDPWLLPGVSLGYRILDSCSKHPWALGGGLSLVSGGGHNCSQVVGVPVIIGDASSTQSITLSTTLGPLGVPMVSYQASCACLSNRLQFPNFFRTIPSDFYQSRTMAQLVRRFGWTWVGAVAVNNDYGLLGVQVFSEEVKAAGVCLAFFETFSRETLASDLPRLVRVIRESEARVVIIFAWYTDAGALLAELARCNVTNRVFLASEAWSTSDSLLQDPALASIGRGVLGIAVRAAPIPGLEQYLRGVRPSQYPGSAVLRSLWEETFGCSPSEAGHKLLPPCGGMETLQTVQSTFVDTSQLRITYNVYLAVYAVAHALHNLLACSRESTPYRKPQCGLGQNIEPRQLLHYLDKVHFTTQLGQDFYFEGGDSQVVYDIVNWQASLDGLLQYTTVGHVEGPYLILNDSAIVWPSGRDTVPQSICTEPCHPGTRKATRKGEPICCFDCLPCADGEISNSTGAVHCDRCPPAFWSNAHHNECIARQVDFLSFDDSMGITLMGVSVSGAFVTVAVGAVFLYHRHTPLVRANNSELSFMLLLALALCFLCALLFVGRPSPWSCKAQHLAFGVSFVLCLSCILVKTIVVVMAFRSTRPGAHAVKWFGLVQQRASVLFFTCIQAAICTAWLSLSPPHPHTNTGLQGSKVILECTVGSALGFGCVLGYIGLLAAVCFLLAFLARKLPDNFNEAKFITFSMLIFCAVWVAFVPAYVSSPGRYTVAVEIFAILASASGLLFCIFAPKCYIIVLMPENNTKKFLMGRKSSHQ
uniref:Olfactory receptor C family, r1 n=1 Tax=Scleropages formosus TaxID=113540 RepID=A0A8C9UX76_SCLFO